MFRTMVAFSVILMPSVVLAPFLVADHPSHAFPSHLPGVINVRQLGAVGDGKHDDTAAIQAALDQASGEGCETFAMVYLPDGIYRLTGTLVANRGRRGSGIGPFLWGQSRRGTILRLDDRINADRQIRDQDDYDKAKQAGERPPLEQVGQAKDPKRILTSVLQLHPFSGGVKTSANWFMRNVRRMTIDVGDNPDVDGIRYFSSNVGILEDLDVVGHGAIAINSGFLGEGGPSLIQNVTLRGFDVGIRSHWAYGQTLCDVTIQDCRTVGVDVIANAVGIENLSVTSTPQALNISYPKTWHWWSGVVAAVGLNLSTNDSSLAAIENTGKLFLRNAHCDPGTRLLKSESAGGGIDDHRCDVYFSQPPIGSDGKPITDAKVDWLPIKRPPNVGWESQPERWIVANEFGISGDGSSDDTAAFQNAMDHAASVGATTVAIAPSPRGGRNWYSLEGSVHIHGSVRHVIGLGWTRITGEGQFLIDGQSAPVVRIENINPFGAKPIHYVHRGKGNTLVLDSLSGHVIGEGSGDIFLTNTPASITLRTPDHDCWARQLNPETRSGGTGDQDALIVNRGSRLWVMGTKSEGDGRRYLTIDSGQTEIYGAYQYTNKKIEPTDPRPIYEVRDATLFAAGNLERCFHGQPYPIKIRSRSGDSVTDLTRSALKASPWNHFLIQPVGVATGQTR